MYRKGTTKNMYKNLDFHFNFLYIWDSQLYTFAVFWILTFSYVYIVILFILCPISSVEIDFIGYCHQHWKLILRGVVKSIITIVIQWCMQDYRSWVKSETNLVSGPFTVHESTACRWDLFEVGLSGRSIIRRHFVANQEFEICARSFRGWPDVYTIKKILDTRIFNTS